MQKSDQDNIFSAALCVLPVELFADTGTCIYKKKMLAVGSVTPVEHQLERSCRLTNTATTSPPDLAAADEPGRTECIPAGSAARDKNSYL